jgi:outer membrane lipoprotein carrier protein
MTVTMRCFILAPLFLTLSLPAAQSAAIDRIVAQIEKRYNVPGFMADFYQLSTIKAMDISDEAAGKMYVRKPAMMRWEYERPERQVIITNVERLWIYRPEDNQVVVGKAPAFFAGGRGAGFLADITVLRRKFDVTIAPSDDERLHVLRLVPIEKTIDVTHILLHVAKADHTVQRVVTYNTYGDETRIDLMNSRFDRVPALNLFNFTIPEGTDVVTMDEE